MRYSAALTIPITVTRDAPEPLHQQIASQVGQAVEQGLLGHRCRLPSTRDLATLLGVSRGVAAAAYELLFSRGYLQPLPRSGSYIAAGRHPVRRARPESTLIDLRPGQVSPEVFPLAAWRAAWRRASFHRPPGQPLPARGLPALRKAIAEHVGPTGDAEVVVTGGTAHGLRIVLDALGVSAAEVALEEPTSPAIHRTVGQPAAVPVDAQGARIDAIPAHCRVLVLSPDANLPLGHPLSPARRRAAAEWAGGRLIELAGELAFRPAAAPLPSIVVGGFCELLTPSLKLGYAIVPPSLAAVVGRRLRDHAEQPPYVTQLAVATLLQEHVLVRLKHRLARQNAHKHQLLQAILGPTKLAGGIDVRYLPEGKDASAIAALLRTRGITVDTLAPYHFSGAPVPQALVIGYAHLPDQVLRYALPIVADALRGTEPAQGPTP
jgi:GntR family transcriptional regulator/MocR family aminotransferase